ncbi:MAG: hypothetical protein E7043_09050 [Lentisphaerae bacterium]|nr:hypothetical protein [Lentisphaerota bacterium]
MNPGELAQLIELDKCGFLISGDESAADFLLRVEKIRKVYADFELMLADGEPIRLFDLFEVSAGQRILPELAGEAAEITRNLYGFAVSHVPGFYLTRQIGWLWGGCLIGDPDENFAVFLLRDAFRKHKRFLNYRREELLAHELCHSVRQVMDEPVLEEYFAYQTSPSPLRRYLGNCFTSDRDAWGFLLPVMLLPAAELLRALWNPAFPSWIFWILAAVYPAFLLIRNFRSRRLVDRARRSLINAGAKQVEAVLFRCTLSEIAGFAAMSADEADKWITGKCQQSPRWQVIYERFFRADGTGNSEDKSNEN